MYRVFYKCIVQIIKTVNCMNRLYIRNRYIFMLDVVSIICASMITHLAVFSGEHLSAYTLFMTGGVYALCTFFVFFLTNVYRVAWSYSGTRELAHFFAINIASILFTYIVFEAMRLFGIAPVLFRRTVFVIAIISVLAMAVVRLMTKEYRRYVSNRHCVYKETSKSAQYRVLVIGAGDAARTIINNSYENMSSSYDIVGLIDDDANKIGKVFWGKKVLGSRLDIVRICKQMEIDKIILAIPSAYYEERKQILEICTHTKCDIKTIPTLSEILDSPDKKNVIRDASIDDLLDRDPIVLDNNGITELVGGKVVMVTGGGGSIGSELCRQIMRFSPRTLVIVDIYENNAYDIQMELNEKYPDNKPVVLIASVRDEKRINEIFDVYRPQVVFHAAAHKHVPLMETSPVEAIKNNVFGTYNLARAADKYNVDKFVMISTDKAVNPTNVMGASKRFCEMIIQCMENESKTDFVAVRFGNVLGSNGSVIPLFKRQIENGGPVRVTHENVIRYFMTIPEAAQLVIQAACYAKGGEIFILDMGKPVRIYDLAQNLIRLSGYIPNVDIKIEITGLRPGEKLYEELLMAEEGLTQTEHEKIFVGRPEFIGIDEIKKGLEALGEAIDDGDSEKVRTVLESVVPTYIRDNVSFNKNCKKQYNKIYTSVKEKN